MPQMSLILLLIAFPFPAMGVDLGISLSIHLLAGVALVILNLPLLSRMGRSDVWFAAFLAWAFLSLAYNMIVLGRGSHIGDSVRLSEARRFIHLGRLVVLLAYVRILQNMLQIGGGRLVATFMRSLTIGATVAVTVGFYQILTIYSPLPFLAFDNLHASYSTLPGGTYFGAQTVPRLLSTFGEPKGYASFANFAWPLLLGYATVLSIRRPEDKARPGGRRAQRWYATMAFMLILQLLLTFSRSGMLVFLGQLLLLGLLFSPCRAFRYGIAASIGFGLILLTFAINPLEGFREFSFTLARPADTVASQLHVLRLLIPISLQQPIFGYGPGGLLFATTHLQRSLLEGVYATYTIEGFLDATVLPLYVFASTGIVGLLFFGMYLLAKIREMLYPVYHWKRIQSDKDTSIMLRFAVVSFAGSLLTFTMQTAWNELWLWTAMAFACATARQSMTQQSIRDSSC